MKVCTDACLFGALVAVCKVCLPETENSSLLDIGTGTGLLPLMLAQKRPGVKIDTVEIDTAAATQAAENIAASPWAKNIQVFNEDVLNFNPNKKYDCIISNPPFFENSLPSADEAKNDAKHDASLTLLQLLQVTDKLLKADGYFAVMLPHHRVEYFIEEAKKIGFSLTKLLSVRQTMKHKFFRGILFFRRKPATAVQSEMIIKEVDQSYTPEFSEALRDYYLFL